MRIIAVLHTTDFRGDHSADVQIHHEVAPGETVEALCDRILKGASTYSRDGADYIALIFEQAVPPPPGEIPF